MIQMMWRCTQIYSIHGLCPAAFHIKCGTPCQNLSCRKEKRQTYKSAQRCIDVGQRVGGWRGAGSSRTKCCHQKNAHERSCKKWACCGLNVYGLPRSCVDKAQSPSTMHWSCKYCKCVGHKHVLGIYSTRKTGQTGSPKRGGGSAPVWALGC